MVLTSKELYGSMLVLMSRTLSKVGHSKGQVRRPKGQSGHLWGGFLFVVVVGCCFFVCCCCCCWLFFVCWVFCCCFFGGGGKKGRVGWLYPTQFQLCVIGMYLDKIPGFGKC